MATKQPFLFIIDNEVAFVFKQHKANNVFITNSQDWDTLDKYNLNFAAIVIVAELNWVSNAGYLGFDIGLDLRRKFKCLLPIIMVSGSQASVFEGLSAKDIRYNLIFGRGTSYLKFSEVATKLSTILESVEPINTAVLADMNEMLFNLFGIITDTLSHRLRQDMQPEVLMETLSELKSLLNEEQIRNTKWNYYATELQKALNSDVQLLALKIQFLEQIKNNIANPIPVFETTSVVDKKHRIMIVEDNAVFANLITTQFESYFTEITITNNAQDAIDILTEDKTNSIVGLICDWRMYQNTNSKYWQKQGYEVLAFAAKHKHMALFAITLLSDTNVHSIRNKLGFDLQLFKKEHFMGFENQKQWEFLAETIIQKCDAVTQVLSAEPRGTNWTKLQPEYIEKRNHNWLVFEADVAIEAQKIFNFYKNAIDQNDTRNVYSINEMGFSLKNNLKNILIIRRVFFAIYGYISQNNIYLQEISPVRLLGNGNQVDTEQKQHSTDVYALLRKDWWDDMANSIPSVAVDEEWAKYDQRIKNFRNVLCIDITELPHRGLLPEEKAWLINNNIDFSFLYKYWAT